MNYLPLNPNLKSHFTLVPRFCAGLIVVYCEDVLLLLLLSLLLMLMLLLWSNSVDDECCGALMFINHTIGSFLLNRGSQPKLLRSLLISKAKNNSNYGIF